MLQKLVLNDIPSTHVVISLTNLGIVGQRLEKSSTRVISLGLTRLNIFIVFFKLIFLIRKLKPDVVQTWMYHADLLGGLAAKLAGVYKIFWNIRNTEIPQILFSTTGIIIRICSVFSYFIPMKIICCAHAARRRHVALRYCNEKMVVIPNGYEIVNNSFSVKVHNLSRGNFGINDDSIVIGVVGRYDYLKGYDILVDAAAYLIKDLGINVTFLCIGRNVSLDNAPLTAHINRLNVTDNFKLIGEVSCVDPFFALMDVFCLPSRSEGFPNVLAEAMLASLPCIVTDVGDASVIVGRTGIVVPPYDHVALARGLNLFINAGESMRISIGKSARNRIIENYDINVILKKYRQVYTDGD